MRNSTRSEVDPFIVMDVMEAARRAEADGRHIIHMEVGQPGTPAPAGARAALARAMQDDPMGYTVALGLPALTRAIKLQNRAARVGFDWPATDQVLDKLREEAAELVAAKDSGDRAHMAEELGDLMFVMANLARHLDIDPEEALRGANAKFTRRFQSIEATLASQGRRPEAQHRDADQLGPAGGETALAERAEVSAQPLGGRLPRATAARLDDVVGQARHTSALVGRLREHRQQLVLGELDPERREVVDERPLEQTRTA